MIKYFLFILFIFSVVFPEKKMQERCKQKYKFDLCARARVMIR